MKKFFKILASIGLVSLILFQLFGFGFMIFEGKLNPPVFVGVVCGIAICCTGLERVWQKHNRLMDMRRYD